MWRLNGNRGLWKQPNLALFKIASAICLFLMSRHALIAERSEPIAPVPLREDIDPKRVDLGERLFQDVRLSHDGRYSCATCHPLDHAGVDGMPVAKSPIGTRQVRNTPTVFNVSLNSTYNWDGITNDLERHTGLVLANPGVMGMSWTDLLARLGGDSSYMAAFRSTYAQGLTRVNVLNAIASFERSLLTPNSRFDRYLRGQSDALTAREKEGYRLFKVYGCIACHQGVNIGGNLYQKFGVFEDMIPAETYPADLGRFRITAVPRDRQVFRVPSLRNVAVTAPYFHDGHEPVLKEAVQTMAKAQLGRRLKDEQIEQIVAYLNTLTGEYKGKGLTGPSAGVKPNG